MEESITLSHQLEAECEAKGYSSGTAYIKLGNYEAAQEDLKQARNTSNIDKCRFAEIVINSEIFYELLYSVPLSLYTKGIGLCL